MLRERRVIYDAYNGLCTVNGEYFNFVCRMAEGRWGRSAFVSNWWRIYRRDPQWVPPYYPRLRRELEPSKNPHLARLDPTFLYVEALHRGFEAQTDGPQSGKGGYLPVQTSFEQVVSAAVILRDERRSDGTATLALLRCSNDLDSLERLIERAAAALAEEGYTRMIGPTGLSPYLESGVLQDGWNETPPIHSAYNPPYLPELCDNLLEPYRSQRLYILDVPDKERPGADAPAKISPVEPVRLAEDLLPVLASISEGRDTPPPDTEEARFLLRWLCTWPATALVAQAGSKPAGFVLMGPDLAERLRRARGGRSPGWRLWLQNAARQTANQGRIYLAGVQPDLRRQGIGRQLMDAALTAAKAQGWRRLAIGPVGEGSPAASFLEDSGASPVRRYRLYQKIL